MKRLLALFLTLVMLLSVFPAAAFAEETPAEAAEAVEEDGGPVESVPVILPEEEACEEQTLEEPDASPDGNLLTPYNFPDQAFLAFLADTSPMRTASSPPKPRVK